VGKNLLGSLSVIVPLVVIKDTQTAVSFFQKFSSTQKIINGERPGRFLRNYGYETKPIQLGPGKKNTCEYPISCGGCFNTKTSGSMKESTNPVRMHTQKMKNQPTTNQKAAPVIQFLGNTMSTQQTSQDVTATTAIEFTVITPPPSVDSLLEQLPAAVTAATVANNLPVDALRSIAGELQGETRRRHKTVRQQIIRVLESYGIENPAELVAEAFIDIAAANTSHATRLLVQTTAQEPINGAELLDALWDKFRSYLSLPDCAAEALALWVVHTFAHDLADKSPILAITSPVKRCGKTTLLTLLEALCAKPQGLSHLTPATLFRIIESEKPTLLIDEADTFLNNNDLRGVLNSGFSRSGMAAVLRTVNGGTVRFSTWAPKAIACIGKLADTLQDRAIEVRLQRKCRTEKVGRLGDIDPQVFATLQDQALAWVTAHTESLRTARPVIPAGLELDDRACDKWAPLLAIADVAGGHWPTTARTAAITLSYSGGAPDETKVSLLLADLRDMFAQNNANKLSTTDILKRLAKIDERPWTCCKTGRGLTPFELARVLTQFSVKSHTLRFGKKTAKGYSAADLAPVFARYAAQPVTPSQQA